LTSAKDSSDTPKHSNKSPTSNNHDTTGDDTKVSAETLISQLETLDKRAKALFREQKYMDAAEVYTEALDLISSRISNHDNDNDSNHGTGNGRNTFHRQMVTLLNNRCAMYEKGGFADLALLGTYYYCIFLECMYCNVLYGCFVAPYLTGVCVLFLRLSLCSFQNPSLIYFLNLSFFYFHDSRTGAAEHIRLF
jgi:hypothetical protein